jgi:hypothetical protein
VALDVVGVAHAKHLIELPTVQVLIVDGNDVYHRENPPRLQSRDYVAAQTKQQPAVVY